MRKTPEKIMKKLNEWYNPDNIDRGKEFEILSYIEHEGTYIFLIRDNTTIQLDRLWVSLFGNQDAQISIDYKESFVYGEHREIVMKTTKDIMDTMRRMLF